MKDRRACLTKPAGVAAGSGGGYGGSTVAQSGISKQLDAAAGHKLLGVDREVVGSRGTIHRRVCGPGSSRSPDHAGGKRRDQSRVSCPIRAFQCVGADRRLHQVAASFKSAGTAPKTEGLGYKSIIRQLLLGLPDEEYAALDDEIDLGAQGEDGSEGSSAELQPAGISDGAEAFAGLRLCRGSRREDPTGQSAATMVGNMIPSVLVARPRQRNAKEREIRCSFRETTGQHTFSLSRRRRLPSSASGSTT